MTNQKTTKRTLLFSVLAIVLCIAMLIGTTFAWFTDTASTGVNKIVSGKLSVDIVDENGKSIDGKSLEFKDVSGSSDILWEPGVTFRTGGFKIKNDGNLAIKYKLSLNGVVGDNMLLDVIKFSVVTADGKDAPAVDLDAFEGTLLKGESTDETLYIQAHMDEAAGNKYQEKELEGIGITVVATQFTYESDSFDDQYDKNATYPVTSTADLKTAVEKGGVIALANDVAITPEIADKTTSTLVAQMTVAKDTVLDLSGKKLTIDPASAGEDFGKASPLMMAVMSGTLTINGDGELNCEAGNNQVYGINVNGGKVVVNSGKFYGAITAIQVQKGELEINGGFFDMAPTCKAAVPQYAKYNINCIDAAWKNGNAKIFIKGGTFVNFDPSADPEGAGTSYVADGYKVVSAAQANGDVWYTVVAK